LTGLPSMGMLGDKSLKGGTSGILFSLLLG
jgi:hypothetical protein